MTQDLIQMQRNANMRTMIAWVELSKIEALFLVFKILVDEHSVRFS